MAEKGIAAGSYPTDNRATTNIVLGLLVLASLRGIWIGIGEIDGATLQCSSEAYARRLSMGRRQRVQVNEDPNISHVAKLEAVRLWDEIEYLRIHKNKPFYHAREMVLAANIRDIAKRYGSEVARRTEAAIMSRSSVSESVNAAFNERLRVYCTKRWGRLRKRDRLSIWLMSMPFSHKPYAEGEPVIYI